MSAKLGFHCVKRLVLIKSLGFPRLLKKKSEFFPAHTALAAGKVHENVRDPYAYRLEDVSKNDIVEISIFEEGGKKYCVDIQIVYRPNGKIPKSQKPSEILPYHRYKQSINDFHINKAPLSIDVRNSFRVFEDGDTTSPPEASPDYDAKKAKVIAHESCRNYLSANLTIVSKKNIDDAKAAGKPILLYDDLFPPEQLKDPPSKIPYAK